jgi:hypothetical protein
MAEGTSIRSLALALVFALVPLSVVHSQAPGADVMAFSDSLSGGPGATAPFTLTQLQYERVKEARLQMRYGIKKLFRERGVSYPAVEAYVRIFKRERQLELWVRPSVNDAYTLLRTYDICALSGELGPKRKQGDGQVPEGFYSIDNFNPYSDYHLSLHINYPNRSDALMGKQLDPGGNIFIHGGCNSIGCLALTDEGIKELYWIAVETRANGQKKIPVDIFPARLGDTDFANLTKVFSANTSLVAFWRSLKPAYDYFEANHRLPRVRIDNTGRYVVNDVVPPAGPAPLGRPLGSPVGAAGAKAGSSSLAPTSTVSAIRGTGRAAVNPRPGKPLGKQVTPGAGND